MGNTQHPASYAETRIRETLPMSDEEAAAQYTEWMAYYRKMRVEAVHGGMIAMRRRSGTNWIKLEETPGKVHAAFGDSVLRGFENRDFLATNDSDEALLAARPRLVPGARFEMQLRQSGAEWQATSMRVRLAEGLPYKFGTQQDVAEFLARLDGEHTLQELVQNLAAEVEAEPGQVRSECLKVVRRLLERGFLTP